MTMNGRQYRSRNAVSVCALLIALAGFVYILGSWDLGIIESIGVFALMLGTAGIMTAFLYAGGPGKYGPADWQVRFSSGSFIALIGAVILMGSNGFAWYVCAALLLIGLSIIAMLNTAVNDRMEKY